MTPPEPHADSNTARTAPKVATPLDIPELLATVPAYDLNLKSRESPESERHRFQQETEEAAYKRTEAGKQAEHGRRMEGFAAGLVVILLIVAAYLALRVKPIPKDFANEKEVEIAKLNTQNDYEIAKLILTGIVSAVAGYGFASAKPKESK